MFRKFLFYLLFFALTIPFLFFIARRSGAVDCAVAQKEFRSEVHYGVVIDKIVDTPNHATPYVIIKYKDEIKWIKLSLDLNKAFNKISISDTIYKASNNNTPQIKKNGRKQLKVKMIDCYE